MTPDRRKLLKEFKKTRQQFDTMIRTSLTCGFSGDNFWVMLISLNEELKDYINELGNDSIEEMVDDMYESKTIKKKLYKSYKKIIRRINWIE